jgi:hypothetical protein
MDELGGLMNKVTLIKWGMITVLVVLIGMATGISIRTYEGMQVFKEVCIERGGTPAWDGKQYQCFEEEK